MGIDPNSLTVLPKNPVDKALAIVDLGDDVVASIKDDMLPGVNFNTIKDIGAKYLNIKITDELKTGGDIPDFRELHEGSFLGRGFVLTTVEGLSRWTAPLRMYSIIERVQWIKGIYDPEIEVEKMESVFLELAIHPRDTFNNYVSRYAEACNKMYGRYPRFTDYDIARKYVLTLSNDKYSFSDFMNSDGNGTADIQKILAHLRVENVVNERVNDFVKDFDSVISITPVSVRQVVSDDDNERSLRCFAQADLVSVVTSDMSMDIDHEVENIPLQWL